MLALVDGRRRFRWDEEAVRTLARAGWTECILAVCIYTVAVLIYFACQREGDQWLQDVRVSVRLCYTSKHTLITGDHSK